MHEERGTLLRCVSQRALCACVCMQGLFCSRMGTFVFLLPQVINIINAAQENSPVTVAEALERVLEILRTTELYSPQLASKEDDPHTNDLVGGLMSVRGSVDICFEALYKEEFSLSDLMYKKLSVSSFCLPNQISGANQSFNGVFLSFFVF